MLMDENAMTWPNLSPKSAWWCVATALNVLVGIMLRKDANGRSARFRGKHDS